jgi:predicted transcriptional regulator
MRPIATRRNVLRYPLDDLLGSAGQVRLLRTLVHEVDAPLGVSDAARLTGLTQAGARKALGRLEECGLVERVGGGRTQQYGPRAQEPLVRSLGRLFDEEQQRYDELLSSLQAALRGLHEAQGAWIERLPARPGDPLEIVVVADARSLSWLAEELRTRLVGIEKEFNLIIESAVFTRADAPTPSAGAPYLWTAEPDDMPASWQPAGTHREAEARSLLMARAVAELIRTDPSLTRRAAHHLDRLAHEGLGTAAGDIAEWRQLLGTYSPDRLRRLLVSNSSRAERLRQSSPFLAVLSPQERDRLMVLMERLR